CGDGRLLYCNAGHNPGLLARNGRVEWLASGGLMLGPFADLVYQSAAVRVEPGDIVCLYSDGITEAESPSGEQSGEERLARALREAKSSAPREIATALQESVRAWCGGGEPTDDVTLVILKITA